VHAVSVVLAAGQGYQQYLRTYDASGAGSKYMKVSPDDRSNKAATGTSYIKEYAHGWDDHGFDAKSNGEAQTKQYAAPNAAKPGPEVMHKGDEARQDGTIERAGYTGKPFAKDMAQGVKDANRYETLFWPHNDSRFSRLAFASNSSSRSSTSSDTAPASALAVASLPDVASNPYTYYSRCLVCIAVSMCTVAVATSYCHAGLRRRDFEARTLPHQCPLLAA